MQISEPVIELINDLKNEGFSLHVDDGKLFCRGRNNQLLQERHRELLRTHKAEIIRYLSDQAAAWQQYQNLIPAERSGFLPLSSAQQRLWFLAQYEAKQSAAYNVPIALKFIGVLDYSALQEGFNHLINRHEILRTKFTLNNDDVVQQEIIPHFVCQLQIENATHEDIYEKIQEEAQKPFILAQLPLITLKLFKINECEHVLLINQHHIITDGWSVGIMLRDLCELYNARRETRTPNLPQLPVQYADYAVWQRAWLDGQVLQRKLDYWCNKLANYQTLQIPHDYPRPNAFTYRGQNYEFICDTALLGSINKLCAEYNVTLFGFLLAAFKILLSRYCNQSDIIIGTPVANREREEIANLLGFFVNTLALRTELLPEFDFATALRSVQQAAIDAYEHQDVPLEELIRALKIPRDISMAPLFQVMFVLQNMDNVGEIKFDGLTVTEYPVAFDFSKYDLTLTCFVKNGQLHGNFEYNVDLFKTETIERLAKHLQNLLAQVIKDPKQKIAHINFLTAAELQYFTRKNELENADVSLRQALHLLFEQQVAKTPHNIALVDDTTSLTYFELNERANQLAHYLRAQFYAVTNEQLASDTLIGLCVERNINIVFGILGILKAGGAYVPLDYKTPKERLRFMLEDTNASFLITEKNVLAQLGWLDDENNFKSKLIVLDDEHDRAQIERYPIFDPTNINSCDDLAYVIYTSGTTGKPKGAMLTHRNVLRLFSVTDKYFHFSSADVWTLFHSYAFDFSVWEIWGALLYGGKLVIVPYLIARDTEKFLALIHARKVTILNQTPSAFMQFMHADQESKEKITALRYVIFGGEALITAQLQPWYEKYGAAKPRLINMYGITETTVHTTYYELSADDAMRNSVGSPIGNGLDDLNLCVLDPDLNFVPLGVPGELYVGGGGVARGYLCRPELTDERFIASPFNANNAADSAKLYKTGDLVRWLDFDALEYLGRIDDQVKIRGFRIELGEITALLCEYQAIAAAAVILSDDNAARKKQIIAYVVFKEGRIATKDELRAYLAARLPDYMFPAVFIVLPDIPLTTNGKIDKKALPRPSDDDYFASESVREAPQSAVEKELADIWSRVLRLKNIGISDNFFAVGGDSIMSIQVIAKARNKGIIVEPKQFFSHPTIRELAQVAQFKGDAISPEDDLTLEKAVQRKREDEAGSVPLTPIQKWFFAQEFANVHYYNQAVLLKLYQAVSPQFLHEALRAIIENHASLRLRYRLEEGVWLQYYAEDKQAFEPVLDVVNLAVLSEVGDVLEDKLIELKCTKVQATLNITNGPVFRAILFQGHSDGMQRLFLVAHHLLIDGVSWRILLEELGNRLQSTKSIAEKFRYFSMSYKKWAKKVVGCAQSHALQREFSYWIDEGRNASALHVDHDAKDHPLVSEIHGTTFTLDCAMTNKLLHEIHKAYHTQIQDILLTALLLAYNELSDKADLLLYLEGHGREIGGENIDLSRTLGWFTAIYPVHLRLPESVSPGEHSDNIGAAIKAIKEKMRAVPNHGIGYGILRYLGAEQQQEVLAQNDKVQLIFNYLGQMNADHDDFSNSAAHERLFCFAAENTGPSIAQDNKTAHLLEINCWITDKVFTGQVNYSIQHYNSNTIDLFCNLYKKHLLLIVAHCLAAKHHFYTPSDFPLTDNVPQKVLDEVASQHVIENIYSLAPLQEGLLFHALYAARDDQYATQIYWHYENSLDAAKLKHAWELLVERHAILRTSFYWQKLDAPIQVVHRSVALPWREVSLADYDCDVQDQYLAEYLKQDREKGFVMDSPCLMRLTLIKLGARKHAFIWTHHHILLDGWCIPILFNELHANYEALVEDDKCVPKIFNYPYQNYIAWLRAQDRAAARAFWHDHLQEFSAPTNLGINRNPLQTRRPITNLQERKLYLNAELTAECACLARQNKVTLNVLLQMAWSIVLSKYSGQNDVVFGVTLSGRPPEVLHIEDMVGLFVNAVPLRVHYENTEKVGEKLQWMHVMTQQLNQYGYLSLSEIQKQSAITAGAALFYSLLVFENYPVDDALQGANQSDAAKIRITNVNSHEKTNFPLTLFVLPGEQLCLKAAYDADNFSAPAVTRLLQHIAQALRWMLRNVDAHIIGAEIITEEEVRQFNSWNSTEYPLPKEQTLAEIFAKHVGANKDKIAVEHGSNTITYDELNRRAVCLAQRLRILYGEQFGHEMPPNTIVGLCVERGINTIAAILAIIQAGGAYMPMLTTYPAARLQLMLDDAKPKIIIAQENMVARLATLCANSTIIIALDDKKIFAKQQSGEPKCEGYINSAGDLAYIIYTSGSTGKPKGVLGTHLGMVNRLQWMWRKYPYSGDEICCQKTSLSFVDAIAEIFSPLLRGIKLIIVDDDTIKDSEKFLQFLAEKRVTRITLVPSLLQHFLTARCELWKNLQHIKYWTLSGELLTKNVIDKFFALLPDAIILNLYGCSEVAADVTCAEIASKSAEGTIGTPISNSKVYILDHNLHSMPLGVLGEVYVTGYGVAKGYLNLSDQTAERFIHNPFSGQIGYERLYKTGDLARYLEDGQIEFIGRADDQIKIRGVRIDPAEVEAVLHSYPGIKQGVVITYEDGDDKNLTAYFTVESDVRVSHLRDYIAQFLPEYMLPTEFVKVEKFPVNVNGKIDKKTLTLMRSKTQADFVVPRTEIEKDLAKIWQNILNLKQVGIYDNFFTIGGHSLKATQMISWINEKFAVNLGIAKIFSAPHLYELAEEIGDAQKKANDFIAVDIVSEEL